MNNPKILLYELNEVPRKLLDLYVYRNPNSALSEIVKNGIIFNTITKDIGELHPWSTWPTVHRGVNNQIHNIRFINQDLRGASKYKPIWEILSENNIDVGVFGSLQSFPPIKNENIKFYLPDTFSPAADAYPNDLKMFQEFNLNLTNRNKAISRGINYSQVLLFLKLLKNGIISRLSARKAIIQIFKERINPKQKARRSIIQNVFTFDIFLKFVNTYKPEFCTYFTNHVAGMMHKYWKDLFPEDFNLTIDQVDNFHSRSIIKALDLADNNLRQLISLSKKENYNIWVVSSMGQASIDRGEYFPELSIKNFLKFIEKLNLDSANFSELPAMHPDYCIEAKDDKSLHLIRVKLKELFDYKNEKILIERYPPTGLKLNLFLRSTKNIGKNREIMFMGESYSLEEFGIELIERDIGTGYHIPDGIFAIYGPNQYKFHKLMNKDLKLDTTQFCPTILKNFNLKIPNYMCHPL